MDRKRVYCLYRVSTTGQVEKDDIPMQKQACHEFANTQNWEIKKEFYEKGISGFKISGKDRDAIQEIQKDAVEEKFDILLVFMFDRIGRREDETPFIVEWFVKNGISVWSVNEGEQRFENHVDKLMNYIRYWQASGESIKTSVRTKTRMAQIVQEGRYRGGFVPYGYKLEKCGKLNKKNSEINDIKIDKEEEIVVKKIFEKYLNEGFGTQRIATYLREKGVKNRKGNNFVNSTIHNMLKNISYTGVLKSGETISQIFPDLQIIDVDTFNQVQKLMFERSNAYKKRRVPLNTKGKALLSGNIFCGHCGARLTLTTNKKKYIRKDGSENINLRLRYICYNKTRHKEICNGQTGYTAKKLDGIIEQILFHIFDSIKEKPRTELIKKQQSKLLNESKIMLKKSVRILSKLETEYRDYKSEIIKAIRGESKFSSVLLNQLIDETEIQIKEVKKEITVLENELSNREETARGLEKQYNNILSWSEIYQNSNMETKKMIASNLIKSIKVSRDYHLEIDFNIEVKDFFGKDFSEVIPKEKELTVK